MKKVLVWNGKGGVGKTTAAVNLAAAEAERGARVLLVDLDQQGQSSIWVGKPGGETPGLARALDVDDPVPIADAAERTDFGFDVLTGSAALVRLQHDLRERAVGADYKLRELLQTGRKRYDLVVMDAPPATELLTIMGLVAADSLLVPHPLDAMALAGMVAVQRMLKLAKPANPKLRLGGVLVINSDETEPLARAIRDELARNFERELLATTVRRSRLLKRAFDKSQPVVRYAPNSIAVDDFRALSAELVERSVVA